MQQDDKAELIDTLGARDPHLENIALSFLSELRSDSPGGKLYAESLANLLAIHLLRHHSSVKQPPVPQDVGLPRTTLRQVIAYIEDHLAEELSLSDIAAVASLSSYHFARLFKHSLGLPPHQYVIHRRIERAKLLLSTTNWPLTPIAHAVGFASEMIYTGIRQTPEMIAEAAIQEDVDALLMSILSGAHMAIFPRVMELLKENDVNDVLVAAGGILPDEDILAIQAMGIKGCFGPGTPTETIIAFVHENIDSTRLQTEVEEEWQTLVEDIAKRTRDPYGVGSELADRIGVKEAGGILI